MGICCHQLARKAARERASEKTEASWSTAGTSERSAASSSGTPAAAARPDALPHAPAQVQSGRPQEAAVAHFTVRVRSRQQACNLHHLDMSDMAASPYLQHACHQVRGPLEGQAHGGHPACTVQAVAAAQRAARGSTW